MQRLTILLACLLVGVMLMSAHAGGSQQAQAHFLETEIAHHLGPESETWWTRIYTRAGKFAGSAVVACTPTGLVTSLQQCGGTYLLPQGRIAVQGLVSSRAAYNLVIIGGTGHYLGARGTLVAVRYADKPRRARLTFFLG